MFSSPINSLPVSPCLLVVSPPLPVVPPVTVGAFGLEDHTLEVLPKVLAPMPSITPPLGNPALDEIQADLQEAFDNFVPRRFQRTKKGVPPLRYTAASATNLVLTHTPLSLLRCFLSILWAPIVTNYPHSHKEAMARPEADKWKVVEDLELSQLWKLQVA